MPYEAATRVELGITSIPGKTLELLIVVPVMSSNIMKTWAIRVSTLVINVVIDV